MIRDPFSTQVFRRSLFILSLLAAGTLTGSAWGMPQDETEIPNAPEIPIPVFSDSAEATADSSPAPRSPFVPGVDVSPGELSDRRGASTVGKNRFQSSSSRDYLIERARQESAARAALLKRYRDAGWNYGQPTIDSNIWYSIHPETNHPFSSNPFLRSRRFFVTPVAIE
jgi:hypothetical protein